MAATTTEPQLVTLDTAIAPYQGVGIRTLRRLIAQGKLPAVKVGKAYLVAPSDVASLLRPTLRPVDARRESDTDRAERQLREAGIG